jgi:predicted AlkP superfamily pyrophosphatase or phosphodiesterase
MSYRYSPETSPFKGFTVLRAIDQIPSDLIRRGTKFLLTSTFCKLLARIKGYSSLHLHNIPFSIIDRFDATIQKSMLDKNPFPNFPTLFDVLRERKITFAYVDSSVLKRRILNAVDKLGPETDFTMVYLHYVDEASHWFGLDSVTFKETLRAIDGLVNYIVKKLSTPSEKPLIFVFSDHGMIGEKKRLDVSFLTKLDGFGKRFIFASDATMVRLWYPDPSSREQIRKAVERVGHCRLLSCEERTKLRIGVQDLSYGEDIFLFDPGYIIFPNSYSYVRPKAMHAYTPDDPTQKGIFIANGGIEIGDKSEVDLVDIMPSILSAMGLAPPATCEGRCMID